jgi:hypothetical protein
MSLREQPAARRGLFGALMGAGFGLIFGVAYAYLRTGPFDFAGWWVADTVDALYAVHPVLGVGVSVVIFAASTAVWGLFRFGVP